jgi:hypothetical protein
MVKALPKFGGKARPSGKLGIYGPDGVQAGLISEWKILPPFFKINSDFLPQNLCFGAFSI